MKTTNEKMQNFEDGSIDAGLWILEQIFSDGDCDYTQEEIAFICGCSKSNIWTYERQGIQKLKAALIERGITPEKLSLWI